MVEVNTVVHFFDSISEVVDFYKWNYEFKWFKMFVKGSLVGTF